MCWEQLRTIGSGNKESARQLTRKQKSKSGESLCKRKLKSFSLQRIGCLLFEDDRTGKFVKKRTRRAKIWFVGSWNPFEMAQFVTHIQPTLLEASQGHVPHHHHHQVGMQHSSHLPHSGHNLPSPPTQNQHNVHHQHHHQAHHNSHAAVKPPHAAKHHGHHHHQPPHQYNNYHVNNHSYSTTNHVSFPKNFLPFRIRSEERVARMVM